MMKSCFNSGWIQVCGMLLSMVFMSMGATINAQPPCAGLIRPAFGYTADGLEVTLVDSSITHDIEVVYEWSMGDGSVYYSTQGFTHTYSGLGEYPVCLTLTDTADAQYCETTFCRMIRVPSSGTCGNVQETSFAYGEGASNTAQFMNTSVSGWPIERLWELGDGYTDTVSSVTHTYLWPGRYYVSLDNYAYDTQDESWCSSRTERWVNIDGNGATCSNELFTNFMAQEIGPEYWAFTAETVTSLVPLGVEVWTFGDEIIGFGPFVLHQYSPIAAGNQVCLLTAATDGTDTCFAYVCRTLEIAAVGIGGSDIGEMLAVWPVPFDDVVYVSGPGIRSGAALELFDAAGRRVVTGSTLPGQAQLALSLPPLSAGVYTLRISNHLGVQSVRVAHR